MECFDCKCEIRGKALRADGVLFHRHHFRCEFCDQTIRRKFYTAESAGQRKKFMCSACKQARNHPKCDRCKKHVDETFIEADGRAFHLECVNCARCQQPFPGGEFVVYKEKKLDLGCFWATRLAEESTRV
ncbi:LIM zinc-binding domain-containing protein [Aphelenchoides fujianensis]|nr:LIM zinc-binding domain-containing protein [Aphelenchoides fujianensis]